MIKECIKKEEGILMLKTNKISNVFIHSFLISALFFAASVYAGDMRPFKGSFSGSAAFTSDTTVDLKGEGIVSHGGKSTNVGTVTIVGPSECANGFSVINQEKITVANGDEINIKITDVSCPVSPGVFEGSGTYEITGGTGRFIGATGSGMFDGLGDFNTGKFTFNLNGSIKY